MVKRYDIFYDSYSSDYGMEPDQFGDYVLYDDYAELKERLEAYESAAVELLSWARPDPQSTEGEYMLCDTETVTALSRVLRGEHDDN